MPPDVYFPDQLNFAAAGRLRFGVPDRNRFPIDRGMRLFDMQLRIGRMTRTSSCCFDIPLIRGALSHAHFGVDELSSIAVIRFPVQVGRGEIDVFDPKFCG